MFSLLTECLGEPEKMTSREDLVRGPLFGDPCPTLYCGAYIIILSLAYALKGVGYR